MPFQHSLFAQNFNLNKSNSYALVVGISNYSDPEIQALNYSHRDAEIFAEFLRDPNGGNIPEKNIRLLVNEKAVLSAIDDAFDWLYKEAKDGDRVFIYFSGHGDVEKQTDWQLGYLLAHNTPFNNYRNSAVRMEDLNLLSLNLSSKKNVRVIIILDACRSGKLAGREINGPALTNEESLKRESNDIRILSCRANEESLETEGLGGGRSVFSYYLVNGLRGLADEEPGAEQDQTVTLEELERFIKPKVRKEAERLSGKTKTQEPVFDSRNENLAMATVDINTLAALKQEIEMSADISNSTAVALKSTSKGIGSAPMVVENTQDAFFEWVEREDLLEEINFQKFLNLEKGEIWPKFYAALKLKAHSNFNEDPGKTLMSNLENQLKQKGKDGNDQKYLERQLSIILHNKGQKILNDYLKGDTAEINNRRYSDYLMETGDYDNYAAMLEVAMNLLDPDHPSYPKLKVKFHYFTGLATRVKVFRSRNPGPLVKQALEEQLKALALDDKAAYIHNELGILYKLDRDFNQAEKHFFIATDLAPTWAIPWSNLANLYITKNDLIKGKEFGEKALVLHPGCASIYNNLGRIYEGLDNHLYAEELYLKSTQLDKKNYFPYERLGFIYLNDTRYDEAEVNFYEAEIRKAGQFMELLVDGPRVPLIDRDMDGVVDFFDKELDINPEDTSVVAEFSRGIIALREQQFEEAENHFRKVISREPNHPLVHHHFGKMLAEQKRYEEAEILLNYANINFLDTSEFDLYVETQVSKRTELERQSGFLSPEIYRDYQYQKKENDYLLADLYRNWQHYAESEQVYQKIIQTDPNESSAYRQLWDLYEFLGRYQEAENWLEKYASIWEYDRQEVFQGFYERMVKRFPEDANWLYKFGIFSFGHGTGMQELKKVLQLQPDHPSIADIHLKIGVLYLSSYPDSAAIYFEKALAFQPDEASFRSRVAKIYVEDHRFQNALSHLEYLHREHQINYPDRLLLFDYLTRSSRFAEAEKLLFDALSFDPIPKREKFDRFGKLYLLNNQPEKALENYQTALSLDSPEMNSYATWYSIARARADLGTDQEALADLETAFLKGFTHSRVIKNDKKWDRFRNREEWQNLMHKYQQDEFPDSSGAGE